MQRIIIDLISHVTDQLCSLEKEVAAVYSTLVLPYWGKEMHGFPETLYGYMMRIFSFIDLLSAYWKGNDKVQTNRMIAFLDKYMRPDHEANSVSVQMWRHKLMHTAQPRSLKDTKTRKTYYWLLHWYQHLPEEQHYTFSDTTDTRILNLGLVYLIRDLKQAAENYKKELATSVDLQGKFYRFHQKLESYEYRDIEQ